MLLGLSGDGGGGRNPVRAMRRKNSTSFWVTKASTGCRRLFGAHGATSLIPFAAMVARRSHALPCRAQVMKGCHLECFSKAVSRECRRCCGQLGPPIASSKLSTAPRHTSEPSQKALVFLLATGLKLRALPRLLLWSGNAGCDASSENLTLLLTTSRLTGLVTSEAAVASSPLAPKCNDNKAATSPLMVSSAVERNPSASAALKLRSSVKSSFPDGASSGTAVPMASCPSCARVESSSRSAASQVITARSLFATTPQTP
mmetsp:Transcript_45486/g.108154  ORF Transcript_45486/g.108154 Transcript_45486/m.108154 type:complete len:259 (+) Transcript_45486:535-1311(+)